MTTQDRVEKWKSLAPSTGNVGGLKPLMTDASDDDVVHVDEDWMASMRPGYVDPTEDITDDDLKKMQ